MSNQPLVLGIETSCDETAVGIVRGRTLLANVIASSVEEHARFGGVVPEIASRAHLEAMPAVIKQALLEAKVSFRDLDAIGSRFDRRRRWRRAPGRAHRRPGKRMRARGDPGDESIGARARDQRHA